jgi:hypothetical protein
MKNHSASPMSAEHRIVSPALTDFSPDEIIAAAEQDILRHERAAPSGTWGAGGTKVRAAICSAHQI